MTKRLKVLHDLAFLILISKAYSKWLLPDIIESALEAQLGDAKKAKKGKQMTKNRLDDIQQALSPLKHLSVPQNSHSKAQNCISNKLAPRAQATLVAHERQLF